MFLSISGILIFALLGTLVETARYTACANHTARTVRTSTEALLTEYNRPLYDNYGLFFLESRGKAYEKVIAEYAADTMEAAGEGTMDFLNGVIQKLQVTDKVYLGDEGAAALQTEIQASMLRRLTKKQLSKWLGRTTEITGTEGMAEDIEKTVDQQREAARLDRHLLRLMEWTDGITVTDGKVSCAGEFVKMFAVKEIKSQNFGITENVVWKRMKGKIDETPQDWSGLERSRFLARIKKVIRLTEQAIQEADLLEREYQNYAGRQTEYADHDKRMGSLIRQMSVLEGNREILVRTQELLQGEETKEEKAVLAELWEGYDTESICFDYTGVEEKGGAESPLDTLSGAWGGGILKLTCKHADKISDASVAEADRFAKLYKEQGKQQEDYGSRVSSLADEEKVSLSGVLGDISSYGMDEFCLDSYIQERFSSYVNPVSGWKKSLEYQWEYIVAGHASDKANLEAVLNRILLIRTPVNFAAVYKDPAKKAQAYSAAAAIVGFTGLEPLIRLTQTLILIAWSFVESMVDIAGLLQGRHVPVIKTSAKVLTTFPEIFQLSGRAITKRAGRFSKATKKSFGYKEYLLLFLAMTDQVIRRYRTMDLIQWDMGKNGYPDFELGSCVFSFKVIAVAVFPSRFFRMPAIGTMLGRDIRNYTYRCEIEKGYL